MKNGFRNFATLMIVLVNLSACSTLGRTILKANLPERPRTEQVKILEETCTEIGGRIYCMIDVEANGALVEALRNHILKLEREPVWEK